MRTIRVSKEAVIRGSPTEGVTLSCGSYRGIQAHPCPLSTQLLCTNFNHSVIMYNAQPHGGATGCG